MGLDWEAPARVGLRRTHCVGCMYGCGECYTNTTFNVSVTHTSLPAGDKLAADGYRARLGEFSGSPNRRDHGRRGCIIFALVGKCFQGVDGAQTSS